MRFLPYNRPIVALVVVMICAVISMCGCSRGGTVYSRGFTEAKFARVKVGMSEHDVLRILDEPLEKHRYESLTYRLVDSSGLVRSTEIELDNGEVIDWDIRVAGAKGVRAGMSRKMAEAKMGTHSSTCTELYIVWQYSRFAYFDGEVRDIAFNPHGRVSRIDKYRSHDD